MYGFLKFSAKILQIFEICKFFANKKVSFLHGNDVTR